MRKSTSILLLFHSSSAYLKEWVKVWSDEFSTSCLPDNSNDVRADGSAMPGFSFYKNYGDYSEYFQNMKSVMKRACSLQTQTRMNSHMRVQYGLK